MVRVASRPVHPLLGSILEVRTNAPVAALTFDDGPDPHHTPRILQALARHGATATFFVLAGRAERHASVLAATRRAGHEIGLHGEDHRPLVGRPMAERVATLRRGRRRLTALLGEPVRYVRPPFGWQDVRTFLLARALGLHVVGWSVAAGDWLDLTPAEVADRAVAGARPGAIVLLHDRAEPPADAPDEIPAAGLDRAAAVELLLRRADAMGLRFVSVGKLLRSGDAVRRPWFPSPPRVTRRPAQPP